MNCPVSLFLQLKAAARKETQPIEGKTVANFQLLNQTVLLLKEGLEKSRN